MRLLTDQDILDEARLFDAIATDREMSVAQKMPTDQTPDWYRGVADGAEVVRKAFIQSRDAPDQRMSSFIEPYEPTEKETGEYKAGWISSMMTTDSVTTQAFENKWPLDVIIRIMAVCRGRACSMWVNSSNEESEQP